MCKLDEPDYGQDMREQLAEQNRQARLAPQVTVSPVCIDPGCPCRG